jgi:hypothetical protein
MHGPPLLGRNTGDLARPVLVDREQHRAEHDAVVLVELVADGGGQVLAGPSRVSAAQVASVAGFPHIR